MVDEMILHVDGDGFFAYCELAAYPELRGSPVVVGKERGIAVAMTYEAKMIGVTRGMPIFKIKRDFPNVKIIPSHFELYEMYSDKLYHVLRRFTSQVEHYSIDECFLLLSGDDAKKAGGWEPLVHAIKQTVQNELGITFSFGLASTKVLAKVASKYQKPDGLTVIFPGDQERFLRATSVKNIWGIGYRSAPKLTKSGIVTAYDFIQMPEAKLARFFARPLVEVWQELQGKRIYDVESGKSEPQKSLQATRTFTPASNERERVYSELSKNVETVCERLRYQCQSAGGFSFFLKNSEFSYSGRHIELATHTQNPTDLLREIDKKFDEVFTPQNRYRATGVTLYNLCRAEKTPQDLFGIQLKKDNDKPLLQAIDAIKTRFGTHALYLGASMSAVKKRQSEAKERSLVDGYIWSLPYPYLGETN